MARGKKLIDYCEEINDYTLINEWNTEKNSPLTPNDVCAGSERKVWWTCPKCGYNYLAGIKNRKRGSKCPCCAGKIVVEGINDLTTTHPELAAQWHPTKNGDLEPTKTSFGMHKRVWWKCPKCGHEWQVEIQDRSKNSGCPNCSMRHTSICEQSLYYYIKKVYQDAENRNTDFGFELDIYIPSINLGIEYDGSPWHKDKITEDNIKDIKCKELNIRLIRLRAVSLPKTVLAENITFEEGRYKKISEGIKALFDHLNISHDFNIDIDEDYQNIVDEKFLKEIKNNLTITHPEVSSSWHPTKNGALKPEYFTHGSSVKVWWICPKCGNVWKSTIARRSQTKGCCPNCFNKKID